MTLLDAKKSKPLEGGPSFSLQHRIVRAVWNTAWLVFASWTPPQLHRWRIFLLRLFGAKIGFRCDVRGSSRVWYPPNLRMANYAMLAERVICYNMAPITLEERALVSQGAYLCAGNHDIDDPDFQLITKPITLSTRSWVATDAFVAPGVKVGEGAVLGARAVAFSDLEPWTLYVGNPAKAKRTRRQTTCVRMNSGSN